MGATFLFLSWYKFFWVLRDWELNQNSFPDPNGIEWMKSIDKKNVQFNSLNSLKVPYFSFVFNFSGLNVYLKNVPIYFRILLCHSIINNNIIIQYNNLLYSNEFSIHFLWFNIRKGSIIWGGYIKSFHKWSQMADEWRWRILVE